MCKDTDNEEKLPLTRVSIDEILDLQREEQMQRQHSEEIKKKAMQERGLIFHSDPIQDDFFWLLRLLEMYHTAATIACLSSLWKLIISGQCKVERTGVLLRHL